MLKEDKNAYGKSNVNETNENQTVGNMFPQK
jgi:hypothetical protein